MFSPDAYRAWQASGRANHRTGMLRQRCRARFASFGLFGDRTRYATAGDRLRWWCAGRTSAARRSGDRRGVAFAPARRPLSRSAGAFRVAALSSESAEGPCAHVRAGGDVGAARCGVVAGGPRDRRLHRHLRRPQMGRQPGRPDRSADRGAAAGVPPHRVLRHAVHRLVRRDVRLQRRHRLLRRTDRLGPWRRRVPVRGVVDAFARAAAEAAPVGHRGRPRRRESRCARTALDAHPAVDVARGRHQRGQGRVRRTRPRRGIGRVVRRDTA